MADRSEFVMRTIQVVHVAKPWRSANRENPPHLYDLRKFVEACEGLPDELVVTVERGSPDGTGRRNLTISVSQAVPVTEEEVYWI